MEQNWKPLRGWEHRYLASDLGEVKSLDSVLTSQKGRVMKQTLSSRGYYKVRLTDGKRRSQGQVHRLICSTFHGAPPPDKPLALHRNGNPLDNRANNLYWGSASDNMQDALKHGTLANSSKTHCPKGHEYSEENTFLRRGGTSRICAQCTRDNAKSLRSVAIPPPAEDPRHGTDHCYNYYNCRCTPCTEAATESTRTRKEKRALGAEDPRHGTVTGYINWGCRCDPCRGAEAERAKTRIRAR